MKKFSVILLIAVLAMTSVFAEDVALTAGISGSVTAEYDIDVQNGTFGKLDTDSSDLALAIGITGATKATEGTDLWAELGASLAFDIDDLEGEGDFAFADLTGEFALDTLAIHKGDVWTWNLLEAKDVTNFAKSFDFAWDQANFKNSLAYDSKFTFKSTETFGTTFTWNKGFTFAARVNGGFNREDVQDYYLGVSTPTFTLAKGLTLKAAGGVGYAYTPEVAAVDLDEGFYDGTTLVPPSEVYVDSDGTYYYFKQTATTPSYLKKTAVEYVPDTEYASEKDMWTLAGAFELAYTTEDKNIAVKADVDQAIGFGKHATLKNKDGEEVDLTYAVDANLQLVFKPATIDVYYAKHALALDSKNKVKGELYNLLSAKAVVDFDMFNPAMKATFEAKNVLNDAVILNTRFDITLAENYKLGAYAKDILTTAEKRDEIILAVDEATYLQANYFGQRVGIDTDLTFGPVEVTTDLYYGIADKLMGFAVDAEYTNKNFVAYAGVESSFVLGEKAEDSGFLGLSAGISTEIIKNATLAFDYATDNLLSKTAVDIVNTNLHKRPSKTWVPTYAYGAGVAAITCTVKF